MLNEYFNVLVITFLNRIVINNIVTYNYTLRTIFRGRGRVESGVFPRF